MESRFNTDLNVEDARPILNKIWKDPCSHATFANVAKKVCPRIVLLHYKD